MRSQVAQVQWHSRALLQLLPVLDRDLQRRVTLLEDEPRSIRIKGSGAGRGGSGVERTVGFIEAAQGPDDDDVYYYIRWRLKLEGETENMGVCTKERKGVP